MASRLYAVAMFFLVILVVAIGDTMRLVLYEFGYHLLGDIAALMFDVVAVLMGVIFLLTKAGVLFRILGVFAVFIAVIRALSDLSLILFRLG